MRELFIQHFDFTLCLRTWGEEANIFILHGWLDQSASWDPIAQELNKRGHSIIIPDHRGHGKSDHAPKSTHYHFPDYVADLSIIHNQLHTPQKPIVLIGHSMGGTIASIYASLFPDRIRQLILIEGLGPASESPSKARTRYKKHIEQRDTPRSHTIFSCVEEAVLRLKKTNPKLSDERALSLTKRQLIQHKEGWIWRFDPRHKERSAISFSEERHAEILQNIYAPCTLVFGKESPYASWIDIEKRSKLIPNLTKTYYIEGGHSPHLSDPDVLANILLQSIF
jgi:pimeloyl-ACP methyl ester carboxylesterase